MELMLQHDQSVLAPSENFPSWQLQNDLREKERQLQILERRIEEKYVLLRAKEEKMDLIERKMLARIKELSLELDEKETALAEMEEKARRVARQSRRHALVGY
jgi:hypothetical protein